MKLLFVEIAVYSVELPLRFKKKQKIINEFCTYLIVSMDFTDNYNVKIKI